MEFLILIGIGLFLIGLGWVLVGISAIRYVSLHSKMNEIKQEG